MDERRAYWAVRTTCPTCKKPGLWIGLMEVTRCTDEVWWETVHTLYAEDKTSRNYGKAMDWVAGKTDELPGEE